MTEIDHREFMRGFASVMDSMRFERLGDFLADDIVWEYPQSGERFRGLANVRGQLENYPDMEPGNSQLEDVVGGTQYALTPMYTLVTVEGSGNRGTSVIKVRYPDGSRWWAVNLYEVRDGKIARSRTFFAPEFEPPDWRAPFRDPA